LPLAATIAASPDLKPSQPLMLCVCASALEALIINTTPFPMTYGSGLYRCGIGQRTQMLSLCQYFMRCFTELRLLRRWPTRSATPRSRRRRAGSTHQDAGASVTNSSRSPRYRSLANSIGRPWTSQVVRVIRSAGASGWVASTSAADASSWVTSSF
jgi:hypothetical protein